MTFAALATAWREDRDPAWREHVTPFLYRHPERFRLAGLACATDLSHHRWTLDTPEDARLLGLIFDALPPDRTGWRDALAVVAAHPGWERINAAIVQRRVSCRAANQQHRMRRGKCCDVRSVVPRLREPQVVDRMQAAQHGDDVVAAQAIVLRRDHQVPVAGVDARVEELHGLAAAFAQEARRDGPGEAPSDPRRGTGRQRRSAGREARPEGCRAPPAGSP